MGEREVSPEACIILMTTESIGRRPPSCLIYSSTCARWIPTGGRARCSRSRGTTA